MSLGVLSACSYTLAGRIKDVLSHLSGAVISANLTGNGNMFRRLTKDLQNRKSDEESRVICL